MYRTENNMANKRDAHPHLSKMNGCPGHLITYLNDCNRLPIAQSPQGRGYSGYQRTPGKNV